MKTFQGKLPATTYHVRAKNPAKFTEFLHAYGCEASSLTGKDFYILCGGVYHYRQQEFRLGTPPTITPKQFKKLVRDAVGEPE